MIIFSTNQIIFTTTRMIYLGSSAGKLGPVVGEVYQQIDLKNKSYLNKVSIFNDLVYAVLSASWTTHSPSLWTVKFGEIIFKVFNIQVIKKSLGGTEGVWRNSYLDDNFRILYAIGGKNTVKENIYILEKSTKF